MPKKKPKAKAPEALTVRAYAARREVSRAAVRRAIDAGRLKESLSKNSRGWTLIDPVKADEEWDAGARLRKEVELAGKGAAQDPPEAGEGPGRRPTMSLVDAQALATETKAELDLLKLEELKGNLVRADLASRLRVNTAHEVREALLAMAADVAQHVAAETDQGKVEIMLENAVLEVLERLADQGEAGAA